MIRELLEHKKIAKNIESYGLWSDRPGIELFSEMLDRTGHPEKSMDLIHVAGTNGKGSSVFFTAEILQGLGFVVGTYTSPHFDDPTERITVGGRTIGYKEFDELANEVLEAVSLSLDYYPTSSDIYLAIALLFFNRCECDFVILETGLGGRLDSTNAVFENEPARISLITRIDLDHTKILGNTIEEIAAEKAGIIRSGSNVVIASMPDNAFRCIKEKCDSLDVKYCSVEDDQEIKALIPVFFKEYEGSYQSENIANAIATVMALGFSKKQIIKTFDNINKSGPRGRLHVIPARAGQPRMVIDGAHNPSGIEALCNYLSHNGIQNAVGICGIKRDKDTAGMLRLIAPYLEMVYLTSVGEGARRTDVVSLQEICQKNGLKTHISKNAQDAVEDATQTGFRNNKTVVVFGSLELSAVVVNITKD